MIHISFMNFIESHGPPPTESFEKANIECCTVMGSNGHLSISGILRKNFIYRIFFVGNFKRIVLLLVTSVAVLLNFYLHVYIIAQCIICLVNQRLSCTAQRISVVNRRRIFRNKSIRKLPMKLYKKYFLICIAPNAKFF